MKRIITMLFFLASAGCFAQNSSLDQTNPENVVKAIKQAATTKNYELLTNLCAPNADGDCLCLCSMAKYKKNISLVPTKYKSSVETFEETFKDLKITGNHYFDTYNGYPTTAIPVSFSGKNEMINLIEIDDNWYLSSF